MYTPDRWILLKVNKDRDPHYRVFATWYGGYLHGSSWRLNSGITHHTEDDMFYYFHGSSGSVYKCHKSNYGVAGMWVGALEYYADKLHATILPHCPDLEKITW